MYVRVTYVYLYHVTYQIAIAQHLSKLTDSVWYSGNIVVQFLKKSKLFYALWLQVQIFIEYHHSNHLNSAYVLMHTTAEKYHHVYHPMHYDHENAWVSIEMMMMHLLELP